MVTMARLSSLGSSTSSMRQTASHGVRGAVKDNSHSISGGKYVPARSFGNDPHKSLQALRFSLNGQRHSNFKINSGNVGNYVSPYAAQQPEVAGPSKAEQIMSNIAMGIGLAKEGAALYNSIKGMIGSGSTEAGSGVDNTSKKSAENAAKKLKAEIGDSPNKIINELKTNNSKEGLTAAISVANDAVKTLENKTGGMTAEQLDQANAQLEAGKARAEAQIKELNQKQSTIQEQIKALNSGPPKPDHDIKLANLVKQQNDLTAEEETLNNQIMDMTANIKDNNKMKDDIATIKDLKTSIADAQTRLDKMTTTSSSE